MGIDRKIIVTGAGGLIGSHAIAEMHSKGYTVVGIYHSRPITPVVWPVLLVDLLNNSESNILDVNSGDVIIHCAARIPTNSTSSEECYDINRRIDDNVISICERYKSGIVFISSTSVYGLTSVRKTENDKPILANLYSKGKFETELRIKSLRSEKKIALRVNAPYAPEQRHNTVLKLFIEKAIANEPLFYHGNGERTQDFTHASDIAKSIACSISSEANGVYNISAGSPISMRGLAKMIVSHIDNCQSNIEPSGIPDEQEGYRALYSIDRAYKYLSWKPQVSLSQGIVDWIERLKK